MALRTVLFAATALALVAPVPAWADVKAGVDAWEQGDYDAAVMQWRGPAAKGDADAQFNMAQAYRLGRGVEANDRQAEVFYAKAAAQGHLKAADNLGLLMFQDGRRQEAMPYVRDAAGRGDPRAQYLLGIAHFNGDLVEKDWVRAYALLTLANSAGLPQATAGIAQMDDYIPLDQREQAQLLATQMKRDADARRTSRLAAADLGSPAGPAVVAEPSPEPARAVAAVPPRASGGAATLPRTIPTAAVAPSIAAAPAAIAEAQRVTGTQSPALAGADYARLAATASAGEVQQVRPIPQTAPAENVAASPARSSSQAPDPAPDPTPTPAVAAVTAAPVQASNGPWKVQLGAFSVAGNAERLWTRLSSRSEIAGRERLLVKSGKLTKLQAGGFASRSAAQSACNTLKRSGQGCLVTR